MDLEDAAALRVCARVEKQRLEAQQECISLVAAARRCLALRRSQQERRRQHKVHSARKRERARCMYA